MSFSDTDIKFISFRSSNLEFKCFLIAVLFLASAPFISCLFFLYPLYKGIINSYNNIFKDKINQIFIISSLIILLRSIISTLVIDNRLSLLTPSLSWAGMANWIPLFACYVGFNPYLDNEFKRKKIIKFFIAGTIPVLISFIGQYWFDWYGPFEILNGLIKWFQRPLTPTNQNVTGLFSNPNYAGVWLSMMLPLSMGLIKEKLYLKEFFKSKIMFLIIIFISTSILLTNSRNAWIGLLITFTLLLGRKYLKWYIPLILFILVFILSSFLPFIPYEISDFTQKVVPDIIQNKFSEIILNFKTYPRLDIWSNAIFFIIKKPLFGWGANSFPSLYFLKTGLSNSHTHNLFLELSISYGLIVSILIFGVIIYILYKSFLSIFLKNQPLSLTEKGWWVAAFLFFFSHLYDVLIYDIRINIASWIFLVGLRNTFKNNKKLRKNKI